MSEADLVAPTAVTDDEDRDPVPFSEDELAEARRYSMLVQWSPEDDAWIATVAELGNARTHGATPAEAVEMGADMVASFLDLCRRHGEPIPPPRLFNDQRL